MSKRTDRFELPAIVLSAQARAPRHLRKSARAPENNYVAEKVVRRGPKKENRNRPGASCGNINALKHGAHTAEMRAFQAQVHFLISAARRTIAIHRALQRGEPVP